MSSHALTASLHTRRRSNKEVAHRRAERSAPQVQSSAGPAEYTPKRSLGWLLGAPLVIFAPAVAALLLSGMSPLSDQAQTLKDAEGRLDAAYVAAMQQPAEPRYELNVGTLWPKLNLASQAGEACPVVRSDLGC